jgi:pantoate--beta-alanine ligase
VRLVKTVAAMSRWAAQWKRAGAKVGFVPTMGYLHAGHLSLVQRARKLVGKSGKVVVSIYVNPTQFAPNEDFSRYPRDLRRDLGFCRAEGVDVVFAPGDQQMYPNAKGQEFSTFVVEEKLSLGLEGRSRPTHFRGVTTVVAKLFNIVQPTVAVFGSKDYQQAMVVRRMVRDLNLPLKVEVAPTFREDDGLAMSSRNKYLEGDLRRQALALWGAMQRARSAVKEKSTAPADSLKQTLQQEIEREPSAKVDYIEFFDPATLVPVETVQRGTHMALAVFIGKTRLIDNTRL